MGCHRHYQTGIAIIAAIHAGGVQDRCHLLKVEILQHLILAPQLVTKIVELGLFFLDQLRHGDGGVDIGERIVGVFVADAISRSQLLQLEAAAVRILALRPDDSLGPEVAAGTHHVDDVPAGIAVLPLATVRVVEIAIEGMARHLIIEAQRIITHPAGARLRQLLVDAGDELVFRHSLLQRLLWCDPGDQA